MIVMRKELAYGAGDSDRAKDKRVDPAAAAMEAMTKAHSDGQCRSRNVKDELD
jgi:hypothetical protein